MQHIFYTNVVCVYVYSLLMGVCEQRATCYSTRVLISLPEEGRDISGITTEKDKTVCVVRKKSDK